MEQRFSQNDNISASELLNQTVINIKGLQEDINDGLIPTLEIMFLAQQEVLDNYILRTFERLDSLTPSQLDTFAKALQNYMSVVYGEEIKDQIEQIEKKVEERIEDNNNVIKLFQGYKTGSENYQISDYRFCNRDDLVCRRRTSVSGRCSSMESQKDEQLNRHQLMGKYGWLSQQIKELKWGLRLKEILDKQGGYSLPFLVRTLFAETIPYSGLVSTSPSLVNLTPKQTNWHTVKSQVQSFLKSVNKHFKLDGSKAGDYYNQQFATEKMKGQRHIQYKDTEIADIGKTIHSDLELNSDDPREKGLQLSNLILDIETGQPFSGNNFALKIIYEMSKAYIDNAKTQEQKSGYRNLFVSLLCLKLYSIYPTVENVNPVGIKGKDIDPCDLYRLRKSIDRFAEYLTNYKIYVGSNEYAFCVEDAALQFASALVEEKQDSRRTVLDLVMQLGKRQAANQKYKTPEQLGLEFLAKIIVYLFKNDKTFDFTLHTPSQPDIDATPENFLKLVLVLTTPLQMEDTADKKNPELQVREVAEIILGIAEQFLGDNPQNMIDSLKQRFRSAQLRQQYHKNYHEVELQRDNSVMVASLIPRGHGKTYIKIENIPEYISEADELALDILRDEYLKVLLEFQPQVLFSSRKNSVCQFDRKENKLDQCDNQGLEFLSGVDCSNLGQSLVGCREQQDLEKNEAANELAKVVDNVAILLVSILSALKKNLQYRFVTIQSGHQPDTHQQKEFLIRLALDPERPHDISEVADRLNEFIEVIARYIDSLSQQNIESNFYNPYNMRNFINIANSVIKLNDVFQIRRSDDIRDLIEKLRYLSGYLIARTEGRLGSQ